MGRKQETYRAKLATAIKALRGGQSQAAFAKRIAISQSTLARIETEEQNVTIDTLELICKRLGCSLSDLIQDA
ncbi:MAG: helix-turn-helix transcriptional regulator [Candidatus Thiodiazotropha sp. LLP2]